jgi:hypothetical protein
VGDIGDCFGICTRAANPIEQEALDDGEAGGEAEASGEPTAAAGEEEEEEEAVVTRRVGWTVFLRSRSDDLHKRIA